MIADARVLDAGTVPSEASVAHRSDELNTLSPVLDHLLDGGRDGHATCPN